jgi:ABC-type transport system involved in multi-copper enzyme maturation permease subunit
MNSPAVLYAIRWLVRDTFRQALASGIFWLMLSVSGICILFCLSVGVRGAESPFAPGETREYLPAGDPAAQHRQHLKRHGVDVPEGELTFAFGAFRVRIGTYRDEVVYFLELLLAGGVADTLGILLALIWTAGFLPTFLEPGLASVMLAKPVPRWVLLLGKYLGVVAFVFVQAALFVGGTWLALGVRTGVWDTAYLLSIPMLLLHFATFFSFSVLLSVWTRSTVACVFGSLLFWMMCWGMNYGRLALHSLADLQGLAPLLEGLVDLGYWVLPKPADFNLLLFDALHGQKYFETLFDVRALQESGLLQPDLSVASSLLFAAGMLGLSAHQLNATDY